MASYAMAHLKLDLLLLETGYKPSKEQKRFNIFLTNSLEEHHEQSGNLFASYLANESKEADRVKKDVPVMVVMGNPPYAVSSSNKNEWIQNLIADYKKDLNERKINLDDDYIKFIRYGQHYIEKNGEGILAYISNNSFIDGITHRQMRKSLLECFDKIYILDLHGNAKKKETAPDGSKDENVFDIMQGVSINIFVKKKQKSKKLADVYHYDLYGKRDFKYSFLDDNSLKTVKWEKLDYSEPNYFFVKKDFKDIKEYEKGFKLDELFIINNSGVSTDRDSLFLEDNTEILIDRIKNLLSSEYTLEFKNKFNVCDSSGYPLLKRISGKVFNENLIINYHYRPFDFKKIYFDNTIISRPAKEVTKHINNNLLLIIPRQVNTDFHHIFVSKLICDSNITSSARLFGAGRLFPLYLYPDENSLTNETVPNFNMGIIKDIEKSLNLNFGNWTLVQSLENSGGTEVLLPKDEFQALDLFDYIYAVLHSPSYREKYKEFLKIDFPRVPYPKPETFWQLVSLGGKLRSLHLLEDTSLDERIIDIKGEGELLIKNSLNKKDFSVEDEKVELRLNDEVSVVNIPLVAWEFYIGGYQPAQKWLKDRVGRVLNRADMKHYNRIINALCKTDLIMKKIDEVL